MNAVMIGKCDMCGKENVNLNRKYYFYKGVECECHSSPHFEIIDHCKYCEPKEPFETRVYIKTETLKQLVRQAELGKATKWLLEEWRYKMALAEFDQIYCTEGGVCITDADSLIDLYEGCKESEEYI